MVAALIFVLALVIVARAWREGRRAEPARVPQLLVRLAIAAIAGTVLLPPAARGTGGLMVALTVAAGLAVVVAFDALASLALWGPFRRRAIIIRAPLAVTTILLAVLHAPWTAIALTGVGALISFRWRAALGTIALFRTSLGAVALATFMIL